MRTQIILILTIAALALTGCVYPSNFANDVAHMGDPAYDNCRRNADTYSNYGDRCAKEADPEVKVAKAEQARQEAEQAAEQQRKQEEAWQQVIRKAESHGYKLITNFDDLILDGKKMADSNAKIMLSAFYKKEGENAYLFPTQFDASEETQRRLPILTDDAQRPLREYLLSLMCTESPGGCPVWVGGHMTTCSYLNPLLANYPPKPCLHVEVVIQ
ncbi:MAG: hypothetical protein KGL56_07875 [Alphaproteobacteria bacterium]|nr:hypothetical protein [Alphaproteobacteria bacterium]